MTTGTSTITKAGTIPEGVGWQFWTWPAKIRGLRRALAQANEIIHHLTREVQRGRHGKHH